MSMAVGGAGMPKVQSGASARTKTTQNVNQNQYQGAASQGTKAAQTINDSLKALNEMVKQTGSTGGSGKSVNKYA